jgi:peroxiredoxin
MPIVRSFAAVVVAALLGSSMAHAQEGKVRPPKPPAVEPRGGVHHPRVAPRVSALVQIGEAAPDFELHDAQGRAVRLSTLRGRWIVLVFDDGRQALAPLAALRGTLDSLDASLVAVCRDKGHTLRAWSQRERIPFTVLSDLTGEISVLYGLSDGSTNLTSPAFVLIDRDGRVQMALLGRRIPPVQIAELVRFAIVGL